MCKPKYPQTKSLVNLTVRRKNNKYQNITDSDMDQRSCIKNWYFEEKRTRAVYQMECSAKDPKDL